MTSIQDIANQPSPKKKEKPRFSFVKTLRLLRISLLICTIPILLIAALTFYERLTYLEGIVASILFVTASTFLARLYLTDVLSLTRYVNQLASDKRAETPPLSFLSNVEELSIGVKSLHLRWAKRKVELESALAESSILFDILPDIVLMLDDTHHVARFNKAAQRFFGFHLDRSPIATLISNTDPNITKTLEHVVETGQQAEFETQISFHTLTKDFRITIRKFPVYSLGGIASVVVLHDITETKQSKEMMKEFVANASHEIRTPLTSVIGFLEMVRTIAKDDPEKQEQFLEIMEQQAKQMTILINDLLSLSTTEMKEHTPLEQQVDILSSLDIAIDNIKFQAQQRKMTIHTSFDTDHLPAVTGEESALTQVAVNLLSNAIKYGKSSTTIDVAAGLTSDNNHVFFSVTNQGDIIPKDEIDKLTRRFYRSDKVRSENINGSGLGLAIVKHILNRHHGQLTITSDKKEGTCFKVILPTGKD